MRAIVGALLAVIAGAAACTVVRQEIGQGSGTTTGAGAGGGSVGPHEPPGDLPEQPDGGLGLDGGPGAQPDEPCSPGEPGYCDPSLPTGCYEGVPGTEGAGMCEAGKRFCNVHGTAYSTCFLQVLPRPDDCANPTEWICDGRPADCSKVVESAVIAATTVTRMAAHPGGGLVRASVLDAGQLVFERVDGGQTLWSTSFDVTWPWDLVYALNALTVGTDGSTIAVVDLSKPELSISWGTASVVGPATVVLELDPGGQLAATSAIDGDSVRMESVAASPGGDVWLAGGFWGEVDFGAGPVQAQAVDGFLLRLDAKGSLVWSRVIDGPDSAAIEAVVVGDDGTSFVAGMDGELAKSCNHSAVMLASYDAGGALRWKKSFVSPLGAGIGSSLALDASGDLYVSGRINADELGNSLDLGGGPLDGRVFLAKFDADGNHLWSRAADDIPHGPAIGGHVAVQGSRVVWANQQDYSIRLRTYDSDGHFLWHRDVDVGGAGPIVDGDATLFPGWGLFGFALQIDGRSAIGGSFAGTINFGDGPVSSVGTPDGFFAVFDP